MAWYNSSWLYRIKITIDCTKVGSNLTNFPIYVNLADMPSSFWSHVQDGGGDIRITKADGTTELAREVVSCDTGNSTGELHFKADSLSGSQNTDFYIYYGNSGASDYLPTDTYGGNAVWSDYTVVLHFAQLGNATQLDSTANGNNFTPQNMESGNRVAGKLTYGLSFDGSNEYLSRAAVLSSTPFTIQTWINPSILGRRIISIGDKDSWSREWAVGIASDGGTQKIEIFAVNSGTYQDTYSLGGVTTGTWYMLHGVFASANSRTIYRDGGNSATGTTSITPINIDSTYIANRVALGTSYFAGIMSEVRIRPSVLSSEWVAAEYNNQNQPLTFYTPGSEEQDFSGIVIDTANFVLSGKHLHFTVHNPSDNQPLALHPSNNFYWNGIKGLPVLFNGHCSDGLESVQSWKWYLDQLAANNNNIIHIMGNYGNDHDSPTFQHMFQRSGTGSTLYGFGSKFDLDSFNTGYFDHLAELCDYAYRKGIYVCVHIFSSFYLRRGPGQWASNGGIFTPENTITNTAAYGFPNMTTSTAQDIHSIFTDSIGGPYANVQVNGKTLLQRQEEIFDNTVNATKEYPNVYYELGTEFTTNRTDWAQYWVTRLHNNAPGKLFTVNIPEPGRQTSGPFSFYTGDNSIFDGIVYHPGYPDYSPHDGSDAMAESLRAFNKIGWYDTDAVDAPVWVTSLELLRDVMWSQIISGVHFRLYQTSSTAFQNDGDEDNVALQNPEYISTIGIASKFFRERDIPLAEMSPNDSLATNGADVLAGAGKYVAYTVDSDFALTLPTGNYKGEWYNPRDGSYTALSPFNSTGSVNFVRPTNEDWVLYVALLTISIDSATFELTANQIKLKTDRKISVNSASFTLSTNQVDLRIRRMQIEAATFNITAQEPGLRAVRKLTIDATSFSIAANQITLNAERRINISSSGFNLVESDFSLIVDRKISTETANYTLLTSNINLQYSQTYSLSIDSNSFQTTARPINLKADRKIQTDTAGFNITTLDVSLKAARTIFLDTVDYSLTTFPVELQYSQFFSISIDPTSLQLNTNQVNLKAGKIINIETAEFIAAEPELILKADRRVSLDATGYNITIHDLQTLRTYTLTIDTPLFELASNQISLLPGRKINITPAGYLFIEYPIGSRIDRKIMIDDAGYSFTWFDIILRYSQAHSLSIDPALFELTAQQLNLKADRRIGILSQSFDLATVPLSLLHKMPATQLILNSEVIPELIFNSEVITELIMKSDIAPELILKSRFK